MFADGFEGRMQDLMDIHRNLDPADDEKPVLVAGDPERAHMEKCDKLGGIPYPENIVTFMVITLQTLLLPILIFNNIITKINFSYKILNIFKKW